MHPKTREKLILTVVGWLAAGLIFFPIFWMVLTSFKTEVEAVATPPKLFFQPTLENYVTVRERADYVHFALNSVIISVGATLLATLIAVPAAYAMAFFPGKRTKDLLLWMLSTKMMPAVGVLIPIYLLFRDTRRDRHALGPDRRLHADEPADRGLDALHLLQGGARRTSSRPGRMDGAKPKQEVWMLLLPLSLPGIASTALLSIILCWNEAFWSLNLTTSNAAPLTTFIASFSAPEGLFWAKLSAASTMAIAPILVFGWMSQRQLVRGLTFGAVK